MSFRFDFKLVEVFVKLINIHITKGAVTFTTVLQTNSTHFNSNLKFAALTNRKLLVLIVISIRFIATLLTIDIGYLLVKFW